MHTFVVIGFFSLDIPCFLGRYCIAKCRPDIYIREPVMPVSYGLIFNDATV